MKYILGIDGGGTKTVCVLIDDKGAILSRAVSGPANYQTVGLSKAKNSIQQAIVNTLSPIGTSLEITSIGLGLAGVDRPEDIKTIRNLVLELQSDIPSLNSITPDTIIVSNDAVIALVGGIGSQVGIAIIAGTGSIAYGWNQSRQIKRSGGWGPILSDEGSAYYLAIEAIKAIFKSHDGRLGATQLTPAILAHLQLTNVEEIIKLIYQSGWNVSKIATLAPIVDQIAIAGDPIALTIIQKAVDELVHNAENVISELFSLDQSFEIVTIGSVWESRSPIRDQFIQNIKAKSPNANIIWPRYEPAYGAALLALETISI